MSRADWTCSISNLDPVSSVRRGGILNENESTGAHSARAAVVTVMKWSVAAAIAHSIESWASGALYQSMGIDVFEAVAEMPG